MEPPSARPASATVARPSVWSRPVRGSRGPAPTHSRDGIVAVAIGLADRDGLDAVSMRALAAALGTGAGSLYRYLSSRDDLLDLMNDAVVAELRPYPDPSGAWLDALLDMGRRQLALHRRHRWLLDLAPRPTGVGPESLAWFDACLNLLEGVPTPATAKFEAIALMTGLVVLVARNDAGPRSSPFAALDADAYPHLASALREPRAEAPEEDLFERTLRILLTGLLLPRVAEPEPGRG